MRDIVSKLVHGVSWLTALLAALATISWIWILAEGNDVWDAFAFGMGMALPFCSATLALGVLPSAVLYARKKLRRDLTSILLSASSFAIVLAEAILMNFVFHMRGE